MLPFAYLLPRQQPEDYSRLPNEIAYDPQTQTSNLILMGESSPTTYSRVGSTGIFDGDVDEGQDDTGKD